MLISIFPFEIIYSFGIHDATKEKRKKKKKKRKKKKEKRKKKKEKRKKKKEKVR